MKTLIPFLSHKAYNLRVASIKQANAAGSGHPTTCLSAADIVAVLFFHIMRFDPDQFDAPNNDRFILSKGHASALLYAVWKELGKLSDEDLLTYRKFDSVLEGHPTFRFPYTEAATGSLGIGLSIGVGEALAARLDNRSYKTYVLLGDAESAEGSVWEAVELAAHYKLNNLIAIIDMNRLGQSDETMVRDHAQQMAARFTAFGWHAVTVNGHDIKAILDIFAKINGMHEMPIVIIARTKKGYGLASVQGKLGFHGKPFVGEQATVMLAELAQKFPDAAAYNNDHAPERILPRDNVKQAVDVARELYPESPYKKGDKVATRKAYGVALAALGDVDESVVSLDADVKNSTYAEIFEAKHPSRFFQCFIAEQNMVSMGVGFDRRGKTPFISTFACFFSRAHDQIRMAAIGQANLRLVGSHVGVSIGEDGPSQMGLEDISMMRCMPKSVVLYPSDGVSTYKLVKEMAEYTEGVSYMRTTRSDTPILYDDSEQFPIGGCKILRQTAQDKTCIIAAGITLFEALKAQEELLKEGISCSVIDLYSIKPLDAETVISVARASGNKIITVEDHYHQGGLGEAVAAAVINTGIQLHSLAVSELPRSGKPAELLAWAGIDAQGIMKAVNKIIKT